jgi:hypothetical protein
MNDTDLVRIGNELRDAAQRDLGNQKRFGLPRRRLIVALAVGVIVLGAGAGIAATVLDKTPKQEEQGLINGSAIFIGTNPTCTQVSADQFHCVLASVPTELTLGAGGSYRGAKMPSVDSTKHIDGGCVGRSDDGLIWDCYLGQAAVRESIVSADFLGQYAPEPGHG